MAPRREAVGELLVADEAIASLVESVEHDEDLVASDRQPKVLRDSGVQLVASDALFPVVQASKHLEDVAQVEISLQHQFPPLLLHLTFDLRHIE